MPILVETYASNFTDGKMVVLKKMDRSLNPIPFTSRTMIYIERRYPKYEREALAIIFSLKEIHIYLLFPHPLKLVTDHKAPSFIFKKKDIHGRLGCWIYFLYENDFEIVYRAEKESAAAEVLSR